MVRGFFSRMLASLSVVAIAVSGAAACTLADMRTDQRPDPDGTPTRITASVIVADLLGVDDVNQQIDVDLIATFEWKDPRLAAHSGCRFAVVNVWTPPITLFNSSNLRIERRNARAQVSIADGGAVTLRNRFTGQISSYHNLHEFPFDSHAFKVEFGSVTHGVEAIEFVPDNDNTWINERLNIAGWSTSGIDLSTRAQVPPNGGDPVSVITLTINAERETGYYLYRVIFPLAFVVAMSWAIFWIPPNRFEFQIGLGATSMLTVIAFNLAIADALPRLGYLTTLDMVVITSITLVFLSIVEALVAGLLVLADRERQAILLDRISRVLFPLALIGGWAYFINRW